MFGGEKKRDSFQHLPLYQRILFRTANTSLKLNTDFKPTLLHISAASYLILFHLSFLYLKLTHDNGTNLIEDGLLIQ